MWLLTMGTVLWRDLFSISAIILLCALVDGSLVHDVDQRPRIMVDNGDMVIIAGRGKNVKFQVAEGGHVYLNNDDLLHLAQMVRQAVGVLGDTESGALSGLQQTLTKLNSAVFGKNGLGSRVSQLELGSGNFSSSGSGGEVSGSVDDKIKTLNTKVASLRRMIVALQNKLKANECSSNPCRNGGTCEDSYDSFICRCPPNWEGTLCDTDVNECARFAGTDLGCQNGATCINKPGTYECSCTTGWFGIHCTQTSNACTSSSSRDLCGHGLCLTQPNTRLGYTCFCEQGWTKDPVTQACTQDVDECASNYPSCSRDPLVACINVPGSFYCGGCPQGYTGNGYYCADIDECQVNNGGCSMNPTVQCINTQGSRKCGMCPPGYQGDGITCSYRGVCQINNGNCHHLARCVENPAMGPSFVQCICPAGYVGSGIGDNGCVPGTAIQPSSHGCSPNPCIHGTCTPIGASFMCSCFVGYTGPTCAIAVDPCANNPCQHGGTCVALQGTYQCRCPSEFTGINCEEQQLSCGGVLNHEEGVLRFPPASVSQTYPPHMSCAWLIATNASKVLNITFTSFHLEDSPDCSYDWLQIHDGRSSGDQLINRFCGNKLPNNGTIISTHNKLYLWFRSDFSIGKDGFSLTWKSIAPVCGGRVEFDSHGSLSSPGYPGVYPKNRDCVWTLSTYLTRRIQLNFVTMNLEKHSNCSYDFLEIRDGATSSSPVMAKFCNISNPAHIMTSGPHAKIRFHSDGEGSGGGFLISYNSVPGLAGCGGMLSGSSGTISCPMELGSYRGNLDCEWVIQVPVGSRIRITFNSFDLEQSRDCRFDKLEVREGKHPTSRLVARYCGNTIPRPYLSHGNALTIIFQTDWSGNGDGFQILYEEVCGGIYSDSTGVLTSVNYPNNYPTNKECIYEISQPLNTAITLEFYDFELETHYNCYYDFLEIRDGHDSTSPLVGKYCDHIPPTVISTHNYLWLKFQSDFSRTRRGFYANYTTVDVTCGGILRNQTGVVESPHYPNLYDHNTKCRWIIAADVGKVIQLRWLNFELEYSYNCNFDYLEIYDNDTMTNGSSRIGKYCGGQAPPDITSMNNILTLVFSSDSSRTSSGFQVSYTQVDISQICGGNYSSPVGTLRSPGYPQQYPHNKDCIWIIKVPSGQQLKLNITDFKLEYHGNCRWDFLEIRNGGSSNSPLIGRYCGTEIPAEIQAISNQLYIHFRTDYSRTAKGFEISWDGTATGCGGTLTAPQGSIMSPNYPQPYDARTECFWKISTSQGSSIQVVFVELALESTMNCHFDYIAFYDGADSSAKLLGKFCQLSSAFVIHSSSNHLFIKFRSDGSNEDRGFLINYATKCITDIEGYQGVIESPNFPSMYPSHLDCKWNIRAPKGNKVNITFSHFALEREPCRFDYVQVSEAYHSEAMYQPLTEKLCGSVLPNRIHSTSDKVQVVMVTDFSIGHSGFRLEWLIDGCGGKLTHPTGEFTSPGYPGSYRDDVECRWHIVAPLDQSVELTVEEMYMEGRLDCRFDSLTIYGGPDKTSPQLHPPLCHRLSQPLVTTSSGNNMLVVFISDFSYSGRGFKASYKTVSLRCGGIFNAPHGRIQSRNYPKNYDPHDDCFWLIQVVPNHVVQLTFIDFNLELHNNCSLDYVKLFDGNTTESPVITTLCGRAMPNITTYRSTSNTMLVRMKADGSVSLKGFAANYTTACGARIIAEDYGIIDLEPSVNVNEENLNCSWIIVAAQPEEHITFTITHMDISPSFENSHDSCEFAFVEVREGDDKDGPLKGKYCGSRAPPQITSVGSALFIHMVSMYGAHYGHFSASYSVYSAGCGGDLTSEHGSFSSPSYPATYPLNYECVWTISSAPGNQMTIVFRSFALEVSESCNKDYLEVREGDGAGRLVGIYCSELPSNITASQTLWIKFHSDGDETAAGFLADYSLVHGNDLTGPFGVIASPLYPRSFLQEGYFSWRVTVQRRMAITITFQDFFIEKYADYCDIYLAIFDGYDETGVQIYRGCGYLIPDPITSSSNMVYIVMHTMAMYHGSYFKLEWAEVERADAPRGRPTSTPIPGCGGRIYLSDGNNGTGNNSYQLQSPGYPNGYAPRLRCEWIIETPPLYHPQMVVQHMDLESYGTYCSDRVSVYQGIGTEDSWTPLKTMCLSNVSLEGPIEAAPFMKVVFTSDFSYNKTGFSSKIYSVCGGNIEAADGVIEVHNMTNKFNDYHRYMVKCQWNVTVRSGRTIAVTFDRFQVRPDPTGSCSNAYLMLRNGHSSDSPILGIGKYCSESIPVVPHTTSNYLYINYQDYYYSDGFKMRFSEVAVTCGGQFTLTSRNKVLNISSLNYPNIPVPHSECTWIIMAPAGERIQVDFNDAFNLSPEGGCTVEYLELRDGGTELSPLIDRFCYFTPSTQTTTGNALFVRYFTDTDDPHTGFQANISIARCGGTIRGFDGEIRSPGYPGEYPSNTECIWRIIGGTNHVLELQFKDIHLPPSYFNCSDVDHLTIIEVIPYNNTENVLQTICGSHPQPNIQLATNQALIKFKTGSKTSYHFQYRGFYMNFSTSYDYCGGELTTPEGQIQSPLYPNGVPHHRFCEWTITVPRGRRITVNILDLDMEFRAGTNLIFFNHDYSYPIAAMKVNSSVRQIESTSNKMKVYYFVRNSANHRGFRATYNSDQPEACGGDLRENSGTISLSESGSSLRSIYCEWRWTNTNPGNQTFAVIVSSALIGYKLTTPCAFRGTKLFTYVDENSPPMGRVCNNITQGSYTIASPFLSTTLVATQTVASGPLNFTAKYRTSPCGGVLAGGQQILSSPGFPNNYAPNLDCVWSVTYPSGQAISVNFLNMNMETNCAKDYIKIHNGPNPLAPRIGQYCGTTPPQNFVTQSNELWIEFHSDNDVQGQGFKLQLTPVTEGCGGIIHTKEGLVTTPNFPNAYPNNGECEWNIQVENGYYIELNFIERFKLEESAQCVNDFVQIFDYHDDNYASLGKFCGSSTPPAFNSTSSRMKILFRSNANIAADGFKIQWKVHCGGLIQNVQSGTLTSPGFPAPYDVELNCNYTVTFPGKILRVNFDFFHLEGGYHGCPFDNVTLYRSSSHDFNEVGVYCGTNTPPEITSIGTFSVIFKTDTWGNFDGFMLRFEVLSCGGILKNPGRIALPRLNIPYYYSEVNCTWVITAPPTNVVLARFSRLETESYSYCYNENSVNIYDGLVTSQDKRLGRFCGNLTQSPPVVISPSNNMVIQVLTYTYSVTNAMEADIIFTISCGDTINATASARTIRSPDRDGDGKYEAGLDCHWLVRAQDGQVLQLGFSSFAVEPCVNVTVDSVNSCGCDFVEIRDGPSQYSPLIEKYCGSQLPTRIISSTNHLWLRFVSDGERQDHGFIAAVTAINSECGPAYLSYNDTPKVLTSPHYPANAPINLRCRWLLEGTEMWFDALEIHVDDVDIEGGGPTCSNGKLEIADADSPHFISEGLGQNYMYYGSTSQEQSAYYASRWPISSVTFCGHVLPHNYYSNSARVFVSLVTSSVPSKGFKLHYARTGCNRNYTGVQGRIRIDSLPHSCVIQIEASPNKTVSLYFMDSQLDWSANCETTGIEVRDGASAESPLLGRLCGYSSYNPIFSTGPNLRIRLWSQLTMVHHNFYAIDMTYTTSDQGRGCGGELYNYGGVFTSPFYPANNISASVCRWRVTVPVNLLATLVFREFDLGSDTRCGTDYLELLDVDLATNIETVRARYCGGDNPATFISQNNVLIVRYTMSVHSDGTGWVAHFSGKPPGVQLQGNYDGEYDYY